jgi:hypothetical protein
VPFIVLEANIGPTLADLIEGSSPLVRDIARVATQASSALSYLHRRGYHNLDLRSVERDIRPGPHEAAGPLDVAPLQPERAS